MEKMKKFKEKIELEERTLSSEIDELFSELELPLSFGGNYVGGIRCLWPDAEIEEEDLRLVNQKICPTHCSGSHYPVEYEKYGFDSYII